MLYVVVSGVSSIMLMSCFFFTWKTAYELRISDWSSDVCSSDLEMYVLLRLKLLADAGLVGQPNAGKSTFLNAVTNAEAKVGDYPFTTLKPQLGVVSHKGREFVVADIPGLIEGAADGVGIGDRFLGHIERCRVLLHLVDASAEDPVDTYLVVRDDQIGRAHV